MIDKIVYYLIFFGFVQLSNIFLRIYFKLGENEKRTKINLISFFSFIPFCLAPSVFIIVFGHDSEGFFNAENYSTIIAMAIALGILNIIYCFLKVNNINKEVEKKEEMKREKEGYYNE